MEENFINNVLSLYQENNWREILNLNIHSNNLLAQKLLWVWPDENNLKFIENTIKVFKLKGILSIGCGCGLLEWIIQASTGLKVVGYEINEEWWKSRYSNPKFIKLEYPDMPPKKEILNPNYALLFCYFNNGSAFLDYINNYEGKLIFIIGPGNGAGRHSNPDPINPNFGQLADNWKLYMCEEVKNTKDFIAVYIKK